MKHLIYLLLPLSLLFSAFQSLAAEDTVNCSVFQKRMDDIKGPYDKNQFSIKEKHFAEGLKLANDILAINSANNKKWTDDFLKKDRTVVELVGFAWLVKNCEMVRFNTMRSLVYTAKGSKDKKLSDETVALVNTIITQAPLSQLANMTDAALLQTVAETGLLPLDLEKAKQLKAKFKEKEVTPNEVYEKMAITLGYKSMDELLATQSQAKSPDFQQFIKKDREILKKQRTQLVALLAQAGSPK